MPDLGLFPGRDDLPGDSRPHQLLEAYAPDRSLPLRGAQPGRGRFRLDGGLHRGFEAAERLGPDLWQMHSLGQAVAGRRRRDEETCRQVPERVGRRGEMPPEREDRKPQQRADKPVRMVGEHEVQGVRGAGEGILQRPVQERQVFPLPALVFVALEDARCEVQHRERVAEPRGDPLPAFERSAQHHHGDVGQAGERCRQARDGPVVAVRLGGGARRRGNEARAGQRQRERARRVGRHVPQVPEERRVETRKVPVARGAHLLEDERMTADGALPEDDEAAREDVRPFHGDGDRKLLVGPAQEVVGPQADALAAQDVHGVAHHGAFAFGDVVFADRGYHRGPLAQVDGAGRHDPRRVHQVKVSAHARQRLFDALEPSDRHVELPADARIGARGAHGELADAAGARRKGDRAACGKALHEHAPAMARHLRPADDPFEGHEHVLSPGRAVLERGAERQVAAADGDAGQRGRDQRAGDAEVFDVPEQMVGVAEPEGEADQRRNGRERDVALLPRDPHAERFLALPHPPADDSDVGDRRRVRAGMRAGQGEAGYLQGPCEARQEMVLLLLGAVTKQQFGRPERIRHHHRHGHVAAARREPGDDLGLRVGGELPAPVLFRNDHPEKAIVLDESPHGGRQVPVYVACLPIAHHGAKPLRFVFQERSFLLRERRSRRRQQLAPLRFAGEKIAFPPDGAGLDRFPFGPGHGRNPAAVPREQRSGEEGAAQRRNAENDDRDGDRGSADDPGGQRHNGFPPRGSASFPLRRMACFLPPVL